MLWGLAAATIPIVIHLLNRRRHQSIEWGAMKFLLESMAQQSKRVRVEELLLMLLRMGLLALLALAMAQPVIQNPYLSQLGRSRQDVVLVLDGSMSTAVEVEEISNFRRQTRLAERIINALREGDTVRVMVASNVPTWLSPSAQYVTRKTRLRLAKQLAVLEPTTGGLDMARCLDEALLGSVEGRNQVRKVFVLTDGQRQGWRLEARRPWDYVVQALDGLAIRPEIRVVRAGEVPTDFANAGIVDVRMSRRVVGTDRPVSFLVTVSNSGTEPQPARSLEWSAGGRTGLAAPVSALLPGQKTTVSISHQFRKGESVLLELRLTDPDDLPLDDVWSHAIQVHANLEVLLVDGDPLRGRLASELAYFRAALDPGNPQRKVGDALVRYKVVTLARLAKVKLSDYDAVVLANVVRLPAGFADRLDQYVRRGGGLLVCPGDRVNLTFYNEALFRDGSGLLPASMGEAVGDVEDRDSAAKVALPGSDHPAMRLLADSDRLDLPEARVYRRFVIDREGLREGVAILLATTGGELLAVEKAHGKGRVIQTGFPLDTAWSNLPLRNAYVVLAHEWVYYLADALMPRWNVRPGEPLIVSVPAQGAGATAKMVGPAGITTAVPGRVEGDRIVFRFAATESPGQYRLQVPTGEGKTTDRLFCVLPDADEINFQLLSDEELAHLTDRIGLTSDQTPGDLLMSMTAQGPGRAVWQWFAIGVLLLLVVEVWMTRHMSSRRRAAAASGR